MKKIICGFLLFSAALMTVSCGSNADKEILKYTTDKTLAIVKLNVDQLEKKLPKDEMMKDSSKMSKDEKEKFQLIMDAKNNGLDTSKPVYFMADIEGDGFAFSLVASVTDKAKFEAGFSKISEKKIKVSEKNFVYADDKLIGSIKEDLMVLSGAMSNPMTSGYGGPTGKEADEAFYNGFWNRKATENKAKIEQIEKSLTNEADLSSWVNLYGIINTASRGYIESLAINKQLTDAAVGFSLNFGEGSIDMKGSTFFNEELKKLVEKYYNGKEIDYSIVKNIELDTAKSFGVGFASFDFIRHFVKEAGFETMANDFLKAQTGLTLDDVTGGLKGTYAFAMFEEEPAQATPADVNDMAMDANEPAELDEYGYVNPYGANPYSPYGGYGAKPNVVVALGINAPKAQKLIDFIGKNPMFGDYIKTYSNKEVFVISTTDSNLALLKSGKAADNKRLKKETGTTSYSWMAGDDINKKINPGTAKVKLVGIESVGKIKDGNANSEVTVKFDKKEKNILYYLMGYE
jgi:hypothetical protein